MEKKLYFVTADASTEAYSCEYMLFHVATSQEEALKWIKEHNMIKLGRKKFYFNPKNTFSDERLISLYIREFLDQPIYIGGYRE